MKYLVTSALLAASIAATSPAIAASNSDPRPVTQTFSESRFSWDKFGDAVFLWAPFDHDGKLEICGLYSTSGGSNGSRFTKRALKQGKIKLEDETMVANLEFFKYARVAGRANRHIGELANCMVTDKDYPQDASKLVTKFRNGNYRIRK